MADGKKDHKYVAKIKFSDKYTRYFYSMSEYQAYLNNSKKAIQESNNDILSSLVSTFTSGTKSLFDGVSEMLSDVNKEGILNKTKNAFHTAVTNKGKEIVNKILKRSSSDSENNHKYIARIETSYGYRYFYTQEAYDAYLKKKEYQDSEPEYLNDIPEIDHDETQDDAMKEVNDNLFKTYSKENQTNCTMCSLAYEMRMRGYDVDAVDKSSSYTISDMPKLYKDLEIHNYTNANLYPTGNNKRKYTDEELRNAYSKYTSFWHGYKTSETSSVKTWNASDIENSIRKNSGNNTRGQIAVVWSSGGGHSLVYEVDKTGNIVVRDTQWNKTYSVDQILEKGVGSLSYARTDNVELAKGVLDAVKHN